MIEQRAGATVIIPLEFEDDEGTPINLTGSTIYWKLKTSDSKDATTVLSKSSAIHVTPLAGLTQITFTHSETLPLSGTYYLDIYTIDNTGNYAYPSLIPDNYIQFLPSA